MTRRGDRPHPYAAGRLLRPYTGVGIDLGEDVVLVQQRVGDLAEGSRRMPVRQFVTADPACLAVGQRIDGLTGLGLGVLGSLDAVIQQRVAHQPPEGLGLGQKILACPVGSLPDR